jgi:hypothetical protein
MQVDVELCEAVEVLLVMTHGGGVVNTLRTGLLNCLNARSQGLTFRHRASYIQGQAFRYSPENAFYIFNQQIYFIN